MPVFCHNTGMSQESSENMPIDGRQRSGLARMAKLSSEERIALAKRGAEMRWANGGNKPLLHAMCGSEETPLRIGEVSIPCYVLEDEKRIITLNGMKSALGISIGGKSAKLGEFLATIEGNPASANELAVQLENPIRFTTADNRKVQYGYEASLLVDMCESVLEARLQQRLPQRFGEMAVRAELLIRGFARVGIDALIDEVTGFQKFRSRNALVELLQKYISRQLLEWTKTFPDEFYTEMFRLKGWDYVNLQPGDSKPSVVGRYTRNVVYERMPVPVIEQLENLNPVVTTKGDRRHKHHQFLTRDIGHPELKAHIDKVVMLMNLSDNWEDFRSKLRKVMPKKWEQWTFQDVLPDPPDAPPTYSDDGLD
jgi:hypothetical protein